MRKSAGKARTFGYSRVFGYARVSTRRQAQRGGTAAQRKALLDAGVPAENLFEDFGFTGKRFDRPKFTALCAQLRKGDTVVFYKLDRLGRSSVEIIQLLHGWSAAGIKFRSISEPMLDTTSPIGKFLTGILALFGELEHDIIRERVLSGLDAARERNRKFGPKYKLSREDEQAFLDKFNSGRHSIHELATLLAVSARTLYRIRKRGGPAARTKDERLARRRFR